MGVGERRLDEGVRRRTVLGATAGAFAALAGCSTLTSEGRRWWPRRHGGPHNTNANDATPPTGALAVQRTYPLWAAVTVADGTCYGSHGASDAAAVDVDGTAVWRSDAPFAAPTVGSDAVYEYGGGVVARSRDGGDVRWEQSFGTLGPVSAPVVRDGVVYAVGPRVVDESRDAIATAPALYAVSADDGQVSWTVPLGGDEQYAPAVTDGLAFAAGGPSGAGPTELVAVDCDAGEPAWRVDATLGHPPVVGDVADLVVAVPARTTLDDARVRAFDFDGRSVWSTPTLPAVDRVALHRETVYCCGRTTEQAAVVRAIDVGTGEGGFERSVDAPPVTDVAAAGGHLFLAGGRFGVDEPPGGALTVVDASDGAVVERYRFPDRPATGVVTAGEHLYVTVGTDETDGETVALGTSPPESDGGGLDGA